MVVIDGYLVAEIVVDHRDDAFPTVSALRTARVVFPACGMVDHVFGNELVDDGEITSSRPTHQFLDDILRIASCHRRIVPDWERYFERYGASRIIAALLAI